MTRFTTLLLLILIFSLSSAFADQQATAVIKAAINYWRDQSSYSVSQMTIHRSNWQRTMTIRLWTLGMKNSLVRVIHPKKDKGNATLTKNDRMWMFSPKTSRVIKIPSSMMNQGWMGSDFSNNEVAKADNLLKYYTHTLKNITNRNGHKVFTIEAVPYEDAPVVWGKEVLKVRGDYIVLEHAFYDQDNILVKKLQTLEIKPMGGKLIATVERMQKAEAPEEWTEIRVIEAKFKIKVSRRTFTLSNLRNPRF